MPKHLQLQQFSVRSGALSDRSAGVPIFLTMTVVIINLNKTNSRLLLIALTVAKKTILMNWKSKNNTHISQWKYLLMDYIAIENVLISTKEQNPFLPLLVVCKCFVFRPLCLT